MPGLIQTAQIKPIANATLNQLAAKVEAKVQSPLQAQLQATIVSGMQIMFSPQTSNMIRQRFTSGDPMTTIPQSIAQLMAAIYAHSGRKMDIRIAVPAGIIMMCHAIDYAEQSNMIQPMNADQVGQLTQSTTFAILKVFGIGQPQIASAIQKAKQSQGVKNGNA